MRKAPKLPNLTVTEKQVEAYLRDEVKKRGGIAYKWVSPGRHGVPDRIVVMPENKIIFMEVKSDKGVMTDNQIREMERLLKLGCRYFTVYGKTDVDFLLQLIDNGKI